MTLCRKLTALAAIMIVAMAAFANSTPTDTPASLDTPYQVRYASNLDFGESYINITNSGARGASTQAGTTASVTGAICVNVYAFAADEQMVSCCSCPVTPNGLVNLGVNRDLTSNTLTPLIPSSVVVKLVATVPVGGTCNHSAANLANESLSSGMLAWGTTLHLTPTTGVYATTETPFSSAQLSAGERSRLGQTCDFIVGNGSGFGICASCRLGGLAD